MNFVLQNLETVGSKEEVLNLLVRRTEQCKKLESKISGTHTSRFLHISFVPIEWEHPNIEFWNLFLYMFAITTYLKVLLHYYYSQFITT